jgi:lipopolysaccharide heptosyltransferase II
MPTITQLEPDTSATPPDTSVKRELVSSSKPVRKIVVRGANWLGDTVMTLPALNLLRQSFPDSEISIITPPGTASLVASTGYVDHVLKYHRKERGIREFLAMCNRLSKEKFDLAVLFQNAFEAALLVFLAGIPERIGFSAQNRGFLLNRPLTPRPAEQIRHQVFDYVELVRVASADASRNGKSGNAISLAPPIPVLRSQEVDREAAKALLTEISPGGHAPAPIVTLNAGATNSQAKCWPEEKYAELANRLTNEFGAHIVLIGNSAERPLAERIASAASRAKISNLAGMTDMQTLIGILDSSAVVIGNDTGPAHVSAALGKPTITIFGPTNEFETAPLGPKTSIVRAENIECQRCMLRTCPIDHRCMERISVERVFNAARPFLLALR